MHVSAGACICTLRRFERCRVCADRGCGPDTFVDEILLGPPAFCWTGRPVCASDCALPPHGPRPIRRSQATLSGSRPAAALCTSEPNGSACAQRHGHLASVHAVRRLVLARPLGAELGLLRGSRRRGLPRQGRRVAAGRRRGMGRSARGAAVVAAAGVAEERARQAEASLPCQKRVHFPRSSAARVERASSVRVPCRIIPAFRAVRRRLGV